MTIQQIGLLLILAGSCLFVFKRWIAQKGAEIYSRFGINVTVEQYARQVQIVAIALFVLGMIGIFSAVADAAPQVPEGSRSRFASAELVALILAV
ncbi:MAG: hypothetical protein ACE5H7_07270 [Acidiferrobacterales bacterium]